MGKEACTNNNFYVNNHYYTTYIQLKLNMLKNTNCNVDLLKSKELGDFNIFLESCKELGIKPYIVFMPTNGFYYDYTGLTQDKRLALYNKLESISKTYGFEYLDMREKEYEPYFFNDVMHIGWKGWLYVNRKITEHYSYIS